MVCWGKSGGSLDSTTFAWRVTVWYFGGNSFLTIFGGKVFIVGVGLPCILLVVGTGTDCVWYVVEIVVGIVWTGGVWTLAPGAGTVFTGTKVPLTFTWTILPTGKPTILPASLYFGK